MIQVFFKLLSFIPKDGDKRKFNHHQTQLWIRNENTAGKDYFLKISAYNKMALYANKDKKMFIGGVLPLSNPLTPKPDENGATRYVKYHPNTNVDYKFGARNLAKY